MSNTKWQELRAEMLAISPAPTFSILSTNGYLSPPDSEWFYHFSEGGFDDIAYVDITPTAPSTLDAIHAALRSVHVPGEITATGFRVFGVVADGQELSYF